MAYNEENFLQISGLQHFCFCRRQWALIHIEQQWAENLRTAEGMILHENAHDESFRESRRDLLVVRGVRVFSPTLGVSGECDIVEFHRGSQGVPLHGREGLWRAYPVEYKHGSPREDHANDLQLCAQAMCLEEMLCCDIPEGALYFGDTRHRERVALTPELRQEVREDLKEMHRLFDRQYTPKVRPTKSCNACSLKELCIPKLMRNKSVPAYMKAHMEGKI